MSEPDFDAKALLHVDRISMRVDRRDPVIEREQAARLEVASLATALREAFEAGRRAGVEESAKVADTAARGLSIVGTTVGSASASGCAIAIRALLTNPKGN